MKKILLLALLPACYSGTITIDTARPGTPPWVKDAATFAKDFWGDHGLYLENKQGGVPVFVVPQDQLDAPKNLGETTIWLGVPIEIRLTANLGTLRPDTKRTRLVQGCVLAHECGHILEGLDHVKDPHSLMAPKLSLPCVIKDGIETCQPTCYWSADDQAAFDRATGENPKE